MRWSMLLNNAMYWVLAFGPSSKPSASTIIQIIIYEFTLLSLVTKKL